MRELGIGTYVDEANATASDPYFPIATANLGTTVFDVVHMFSEQGISAVPVLDEDGKVLNLYETVDVIVRIPRVACHVAGADASRLSFGMARTSLSTSTSLKPLSSAHWTLQAS